MRIHPFLVIFLLAAGIPGQSGRTASDPVPSATPAIGQQADPTVKQMYDEANTYSKTKFAEFTAKKIPYDDDLMERTRLEQRQLAAKYAAIATARTNLTGDDNYYLGLLYLIAQNYDGTVDALRRYVAIEIAAAERRQTARSVIVFSLAKLRKMDEAESILAEYIKTGPEKLTERSRMENEIARAYKKQKDPAKMAPHAEAAYKAAKTMLKDASTMARGMEEIVDDALLVFDAYRDMGDEKRAGDAIEDMRMMAATLGSSTFYFYAVNKKILYMIDLGKKKEAMEYYAASIADSGKYLAKPLQSDFILRLRRKEPQYKLLGEPAIEIASVDQWFPGQRRSLADMKGKVIMLDFWATWCQPCLDTFPSLRDIYQSFARDGLEILGVTHYTGMADDVAVTERDEIAFLKQFREKYNLPYDIVVSHGQSTQLLYGADALPTTVIIDRKGMIRYIESGTSPLRIQEIRDEVERLIAEK